MPWGFPLEVSWSVVLFLDFSKYFHIEKNILPQYLSRMAFINAYIVENSQIYFIKFS